MTQKMAGRARRFARREEGTQVVELAFVLPILFLLFATATEVGRFFYTYTTLNKATVAGARYLSTAGLTNGAFASSDVTAAKNLVLCGNSAGCGGTGQPSPVVGDLTTSNISDPVLAGSGSGRTVTIGVTGYVYQPMFNLGAMLGQSSMFSIQVQPSTTMRYMR